MNPFLRLSATITCVLLAANFAFGQEAAFEIPNPFADLPATSEANADGSDINGAVAATVRPAKHQGERIDMLDDFEQATKRGAQS